MASYGVQLKDKNGNKVYPSPYWPIGSIYLSINNVNPGTIFGGTWERFAYGRCLVGVDENQTEFNTVLKSGGSKYLQSHTHSFSYSGSTGGAGNHSHQVYLNGDTSFPMIGFPGWAGSTISTNRVLMNQSSGTGFYMYTGTDGNHDHSFSGSGTTSSSGEGNAQNLQPFITCYVWLRTA